MYLKFIVTTLCLIPLTFAGDSGNSPPCGVECKPGEEYTTCGTCDQVCGAELVGCAQVCRVGCFCKKGLVRDSNGNCIPPSKCPSACPAGEVYAECGGCDKTCTNSNPICPLICKPGCVCADGLIRDSNGKCIPPSKCPNVCPVGEVYAQCAGCEKTCTNSNPICPLICKPGCVCADGLIRDSNGKCIPPSKCPNVCPVGEVYAQCAGCDPSCGNRNPICPRICKPGCNCAEGLVRDCSGKCISPTQCSVCSTNEHFTTCGTCDPSCKVPEPLCAQVCRTGCFCDSGYRRDSRGNCVDPIQCPVPIAIPADS